jgi:hypothetical protein
MADSTARKPVTWRVSPGGLCFGALAVILMAVMTGVAVNAAVRGENPVILVGIFPLFGDRRVAGCLHPVNHADRCRGDHSQSDRRQPDPLGRSPRCRPPGRALPQLRHARLGNWVGSAEVAPGHDAGPKHESRPGDRRDPSRCPRSRCSAAVPAVWARLAQGRTPPGNAALSRRIPPAPRRSQPTMKPV